MPGAIYLGDPITGTAGNDILVNTDYTSTSAVFMGSDAGECRILR